MTETAVLTQLGAATGIAAVLFAVRRIRTAVGALRGRLRTVTAGARVSDVLLAGGSEAMAAALPAVRLLADGVVAVYPVSSPAQPSRLLVAVPPNCDDPSIRASAALLAAVNVSSVEVPEFERAIRTRTAQRGVDIRSLVRRGATSLPYATRDKLFERVRRTPFVVVPLVRRDGTAGGLLLAVGERNDLERKAAALSQVSSRLALLLPPERKGPARAAAGDLPRRRSRSAAAHDADAVLWLDARGDVASCELLQDEWLIASPRSLQELFRGENQALLLQRASGTRPVALGLARIGDETLAEVSLLRLADGDQNTWGYAAFLRRVNGARTPDLDSVTPSSRSASPRA